MILDTHSQRGIDSRKLYMWFLRGDCKINVTKHVTNLTNHFAKIMQI